MKYDLVTQQLIVSSLRRIPKQSQKNQTNTKSIEYRIYTNPTTCYVRFINDFSHYILHKMIHNILLDILHNMLPGKWNYRHM